MKTFDIKRFGMAVKWSLMTEKKQIFRTFISLFVAYLIVLFAFTGAFSRYSVPVNIYMIAQASGTCMLVWMLTGGYLTAELFSNLRTKQNRAMFFMLPASNAEKFWSRVALAMFYSLCVSTAAWIAADLVQMLLSWLFTGSAMSAVTHIFTEGRIKEAWDFLSTEKDNGFGLWASRIIAWTMLTLWLVSSYILGGAFFRKLPVVLTTLSWFVFWALTGFIGVNSMELINDSYARIEINFMLGIETTANIIVSVTAALLAWMNVWLAKRLFCRMEVVDRKWLNL